MIENPLCLSHRHFLKNTKLYCFHYNTFKKIIEKSHNRKNLHLVECLNENTFLKILAEAEGEFGHSHHPAHRTTVLWGRSRAVEGVVLWCDVFCVGLDNLFLLVIPNILIKNMKNAQCFHFFCAKTPFSFGFSRKKTKIEKPYLP